MADVFERERTVIVSSPALIIEGPIQQRDGVIHLRAERFTPLGGGAGAVSRSHDFH
jgi:error-prone DNA polymerase